MYNQNKYLIDYILSVLNITEHKYATPPYGKFSSGRVKYDLFTITGAICHRGTVKIMQHLIEIIGEESFGKNAFIRDYWGSAIDKKTLKMVKCILSIKFVKERLLTSDAELGAILKTLNKKFDESVAKCLVKELELNETKLYQLDEMYGLNVKQILSVNM